jgi:membrane-bound serine protease (ClpP class)
MTSVHWFIVLLVTGATLVGAEVFLPGAVMGIAGAVALLGALVLGFIAFPGYGPVIAASIFGFVGLMVWVWIRYFPRSAIGRRMAVADDLSGAKSADPRCQALQGLTGVAVSELRPAGFALLNGNRVDVVTRGEMVAKDTPVRVVKVEGNRVVVAKDERS